MPKFMAHIETKINEWITNIMNRNQEFIESGKAEELFENGQDLETSMPED